MENATAKALEKTFSLTIEGKIKESLEEVIKQFDRLTDGLEYEEKKVVKKLFFSSAKKACDEFFAEKMGS